MKTLTIKARQEADRERLRKRNGFTLVELLTVVAIIGMLGAVSLSAVRGAVQTARETQTRTTIGKIDNVITGIYEKYQYRRLDVSDFSQRFPNETETAMKRAYYRVLKMRDLIRCDMPCTYGEVVQESAYNEDGSRDYGQFTPLQSIYFRELGNAGVDANSPNVNAELLYLVVMNADPEARSSFSDREVADTDGNGLLEFVDGWKQPIRWMRWAPGLCLSDRQPDVDDPDLDDKVNADPFDPLDIIRMLELDNMSPGWFLVPYVYSAGPDGEYGLVTPEYVEEQDPSFMNDPFTYSRNYPAATAGSAGELDENGDLVPSKKYTDNIDNHTLVR